MRRNKRNSSHLSYNDIWKYFMSLEEQIFLKDQNNRLLWRFFKLILHFYFDVKTRSDFFFWCKTVLHFKKPKLKRKHLIGESIVKEFENILRNYVLLSNKIIAFLDVSRAFLFSISITNLLYIKKAKRRNNRFSQGEHLKRSC